MVLRERLMKKRAGIMIILLILAAMASMQSASGDPVTFQQGMDGYTGGEDRAISNDLPQPSETRLRIKYLYGKERYNTIVRFDNIEDELNGAIVTSAILTLTYRAEHVGYTPAMIDIYPCLKHWMMPDWDDATPTTVWDTPGAQGAGDRGTLNNSVYMGYRSYGGTEYLEGKYDFTLSTDLVQSWIDEPDSNHGVILTMNPSYPTDVTFVSNEDFDPCCHPVLTITIETLVDVPNVIGKLYDIAVGEINNADLTVGEVRYEYNEEKDPCYVFDQDPCSGSLDMGESIDLWVSRGPQPTPDYNGDNVVDTLDLISLADDWLKCEDVTTDLTDDGCVDMNDFVVFAAAWMEVTIVADIDGDGCVGIGDLAEMATQWLTCEETNTADLFDGQDGGCVNMLDYAIMSRQWDLCDGP